MNHEPRYSQLNDKTNTVREELLQTERCHGLGSIYVVLGFVFVSFQIFLALVRLSPVESYAARLSRLFLGLFESCLSLLGLLVRLFAYPWSCCLPFVGSLQLSSVPVLNVTEPSLVLVPLKSGESRETERL